MGMNIIKFFIALLTWISVRGQRIPLKSLAGTYLSNGSISFIWDPLVTDAEISEYFVNITSKFKVVKQLKVTNKHYVLEHTLPDTTYTCDITLHGVKNVLGKSTTTVHTDPAVFCNVGSNTTLTLPLPANRIVDISLSGKVIFTFSKGMQRTRSTEYDISLSHKTENVTLMFNYLKKEQAGYYYTQARSGGLIFGGSLLIVLDTPTKPVIEVYPVSPPIKTNAILTCSSQSQTKPDNHGLELMTLWKLNESSIFDPRLFVNGSDLTIYPVRLEDKYNTYTCVTLENTPDMVQMSPSSNPFHVNPTYGPLEILIETHQLSSIMFGKQNITVVCRTDCFPICKLWWIEDETLISYNESNNTLTLEINDVQRKKEITYTCKAVNKKTMETKNGTLTFVVYYPPIITKASYSIDGDPLKVLNDHNLSAYEGSKLSIFVIIDSNPQSDVAMKSLHAKEPVGIVTSDQSEYIITFRSLQCNQSGIYFITASNLVTQSKSDFPPQLREVNLAVNCSPRLANSAKPLIQKAGKVGDVVLISITVEAFPKPTANWPSAVGEHRVVRINDYTYNIKGQITIARQSDFRDYNVTVTNTISGIQADLNLVVRIRPEGVPDTPLNFTISERGSTYIIITWISNFDGGSEQTFYVNYSITDGNWTQEGKNLKDNGQGLLHTFKLMDIKPNTVYNVRLGTVNDYGSGVYSEIEFSTLGRASEKKIFSIKVMIIVVSILVLIIIITVIVIVIRHSRKTQGKKKCRPQKTGKRHNSDFPDTTNFPQELLHRPRRSRAEITKPSDMKESTVDSIDADEETLQLGDRHEELQPLRKSLPLKDVGNIKHEVQLESAGSPTHENNCKEDDANSPHLEDVLADENDSGHVEVTTLYEDLNTADMGIPSGYEILGGLEKESQKTSESYEKLQCTSSSDGYEEPIKRDGTSCKISSRERTSDRR